MLLKRIVKVFYIRLYTSFTTGHHSYQPIRTRCSEVNIRQSMQERFRHNCT